MDKLIKDLLVFSTALEKLGWVDHSQKVDKIAIKLLSEDSCEALVNQRKALLLQAKSLVRSLQVELGDTHPRSHALAVINYEINNEINS